MSDQFTSVEEKGLGTNLIDSIKGVAVGGLLFICSFVVLWMNEGRVDLLKDLAHYVLERRV